VKISRRHVLATLAASSVAAVACQPDPPEAPSGPSSPAASPSASPSALPFGLETPSRVEAVVFDGGFGTGYVRAAAGLLSDLYDGVTVLVTPTTDISGTVADLFADGATPPDLIDNSGVGKLSVASMADDFASLDDVVESENLEGIPIAETLYHGVLDAGTFNGRLIAINYALSVYGLWHSATAFAAAGWAVPATWDTLLELGEEARREGRYLFVWGEGAESYYQELAITSAIKEGGHDVRRALDNLEEGCWFHPAVSGVLDQLELCVAEGFLLDGGPYLEAQERWSRDGEALLYPSGAWIAHEMAGTASADFAFTVAPVPTLTAAPTLPATAIHSAPTEQFLVPERANNPAGGKELLRIMLSQQAAADFSRTNLIPTVVRGSVPADVESTALASQTRLLADAGEDVFTWRFDSHYGLGQETNNAWRGFLRAEYGAAVLAERLQSLADAVRNDPDIERYTVD
jgi:N-acetylglucosamine transport system substrate-binding protein